MSKLKLGQPLTQEACTAHLGSVADALFVISGKWKLRIIIALKGGNKRFNEMQRQITGLSAKVLSTELKDLELNGFIRRNVIPSTPVIVEYELTDYADTLNDVLHALSEWGAMHKEEIKKAMRKKKLAESQS